jgi:hypothetical protein
MLDNSILPTLCFILFWLSLQTISPHTEDNVFNLIKIAIKDYRLRLFKYKTNVMRSFTVYVPENKVPFFKELINSLRFKVKEGKAEEIELSEAHKALLSDRLENYKNNPENYQDWEDVQKDIEKIL